MRKKILAVLAGLALALGVTVAIAAPASAADTDCPAGQGCLWTNANYTGFRAQLPISVYGTTCHNMSELSAGFVNTVSSARVTYGSGYGIELFTTTNCGPWEFGMPQFTEVGLFGGTVPNYNDNFESFKIAVVNG